MAKYDWEFIKPLDQSAAIANMAYGNKQITDGLQGMVGAVTGLADTYKQRNTDEILNALYGAQTSADLPNAMSAVQALQAQYGRGYDQAKVREAIDTRGSTLGQRDLQAINLQQAQAAQAALPQIKQMQIERLKASGAPQAQIDALAGINGIDVSSFATGLIGDARDNRDYTDKRSDIEYQRNYQRERDRVSDFYADESNNRANIATASSIAGMYETPGQSGYITNPDGSISTYNSPAVTKGSVFSSLMGSLYQTESGLRHRDSNGNLITSPKGAKGVAQIMPATAAKPGYGMKPINLETSTPEEQMAWSEEYINRIAKHHKFTVPQAVAAYNAGGGAVEKAIKKHGTNWLAALPKETQDYVPKVLNGAHAATAAVGGGKPVSQAKMSEVSSGYQNAIAKLTADFNADTLKSQKKGSLAETGKSLSTWAAGKKDNGIIFAGNNSWFTSASDLVDMAKKDPTFSKLPETAQMNILEGAYAKMNDVNKLQYVPDGDLQKFISNESKNYHVNRKAAFNQAKEAAFEQAYQGMVQQFQAVGSHPPSRESARQLLDPTYKPEAQAKPQQAAAKTEAPKATAKQAAAAVKPATPAKSNIVKADTSKMDKVLADRAKRKKAQADAINAKAKAEKAKEKANGFIPTKPLLTQTTTMTPKQINDLMEKYKVR